MMNSVESIFLLIALLNTATRAEKVVYAQVGQTVTLKEEVSQLSVYMSWYFGGNRIAWLNPQGGQNIERNGIWKDKLTLTHDSLMIKSIQEENFGTYVNKVSKNGVERITAYRVIKVTVGMNATMPLLPGDYLSLTCNMEMPNNQRKPNIHWEAPDKKQKSANEGTLNIKATTQEAGEWTCVVGEDFKAAVSVKVVDFSRSPGCQYTSTKSPLFIPFSISPNLPLERIKQGIKEVKLSFISKSSPSPDPLILFVLSPGNSFNWMGQDGELMKADATTGNFSLFRNLGRDDDSGNYKCSITFKTGETLNHIIEVRVLKIIASPGAEIFSGQGLNLTCTTGEALPPDMELKWIPPKTVPDARKLKPHVTITRVGMEHSGNWTCEMWQKSTKSLVVSAAITLKVEPLLSAWMLVTICSTAAIVVLLLVLSFILYRRRQRRTRYPRHRLCQCKNPKPKGFYRS